jgi:hypothetical protein
MFKVGDLIKVHTDGYNAKHIYQVTGLSYPYNRDYPDLELDNGIDSVCAELCSKVEVQEQVINQIFWDKISNEWNIHKALETTNHWHVAVYDDESCNIMVVEVKDGIGYIILPSFSNEKIDKDYIFNPCDKENNKIQVFKHYEDCWYQACSIVSEVTGIDIDEVSRRNGN